MRGQRPGRFRGPGAVGDPVAWLLGNEARGLPPEALSRADAACQQAVELLTKDVEVGEVYEGEVKRIMAFGAFIEVLPGKEGLLHISKMADYRVDKVEDVMNLGDKVKVKVKEIDDQGRINLVRG